MSSSFHWRSSKFGCVASRRHSGLPARLRLGVVLLLAMLAVPLPAAQIRVRKGTLVPIKLHYDITTENVQKGDRVEFEVAEDVKLYSYTVIQKGSSAWGQVIRVKGAGKKRAKDASVTFRLMAVRAVDKSEIPLRISPTKSKKTDPKEEEIEESSPIPGLRERMIGAEKGKEYAAYTDMDATVNASETAPATGSTPTTPGTPATSSQPLSTSPAGTVQSSQPAGSTGGTTNPATNPASLLGLDPASINFTSDPSGADIVIDGGFVGNTPSTLRVAPGRHVIELRLAGYRPWTRTMMVGPGSTPSIRANLDKE